MAIITQVTELLQGLLEKLLEKSMDMPAHSLATKAFTTCNGSSNWMPGELAHPLPRKKTESAEAGSLPTMTIHSHRKRLI